MKFKVDENLPIDVAEILRSNGHDAVTVIDQRLKGAADSTLIAACEREGRVLVTLDLDFANIVAYPPGRYAGIIVLRPRRLDKPRVVELVRQVTPLLTTDVVEHRLLIVEPGRVRVRGGPES